MPAYVCVKAGQALCPRAATEYVLDLVTGGCTESYTATAKAAPKTGGALSFGFRYLAFDLCFPIVGLSSSVICKGVLCGEHTGN